MKKLFSVMLSFVLVFTIVLSTTIAVNAGTMKLNKTSATVNVGYTLKLKVSYASKTVKWTTSSKSVATVKSTGLRTATVTAKKPGTVTIKAKVNGKTFTCKVTTKYGIGSRQNPAIAKNGVTFTNSAKQKYHYKALEVISGEEATSLYRTIDPEMYDYYMEYCPEEFEGKKMVCIKFYVEAISGCNKSSIATFDVFSAYSLFNADSTSEISGASERQWTGTEQYKDLLGLRLFNGGSGEYYEFFLLPEDINAFTIYHYDRKYDYYWVSYQL